MIKIVQNEYNISDCVRLLSAHPVSSISVDSEEVTNRISELSAEYEESSSRISKSNISKIKRYMYKVIDTLTNNYDENTRMSNLLLFWSCTGQKIVSHPIELKNIFEYNIDMVDFVNVGSKSMVHISYEDVYKIMAFEMMYRDFGETHASIEEKLAIVGIASITDSTELSKYIDSNIIQKSRQIPITDSAYINSSKTEAFDYFNSGSITGKKIKPGYYSDIVFNSIDIANILLLSSIMQTLDNKHIGFEICAVNECGIYLIIDNTTDFELLKQDEFFEPALIRAFGRKFEVVPKVEIFTTDRN